MKIISKHKDFYDWCSSIFGIDEKAIFDRRGTETNQILVLEKALRETPYSVLDSFNQNRLRDGRYWNRGWVLFGDRIWDFEITTDGDLYKRNKDLHIQWDSPEDLILKRGEKDNGISTKRMWRGGYRLISDIAIRNGDRVNRKSLLEKTYRGNSRSLPPKEEFEVTPIILSINRHFWFNPILKGTPIEKFVPAQEAWTSIQDFISSLKDVEIVDSRTDKEKLQSAGFDSKTSFRNIK